MHTCKVNKILNFKVMGLNGNDQTACLCLARDIRLAAEDHSRYQYNRRILSKERKESIRTNNIE